MLVFVFEQLSIRTTVFEQLPEYGGTPCIEHSDKRGLPLVQLGKLAIRCRRASDFCMDEQMCATPNLRRLNLI